jgi:cytoskeletal protein CcmA (bactofilin family)
MWKKREDEKTGAWGESPNESSPAPRPASSTAAAVGSRPAPFESAKIGASVSLKGELFGSEDLYIDGAVQGKIELHGHTLTVGPNGRIHADITAKSIVIHGKVDGNVRGSDRVELKSSAVLAGNITAHRIAIEEGGYLQGKVELVAEEAKAEAAPAGKPAIGAAAATAAGALRSPIAVEPKK